jgi:hypothetical protein
MLQRYLLPMIALTVLCRTSGGQAPARAGTPVDTSPVGAEILPVAAGTSASPGAPPEAPLPAPATTGSAPDFGGLPGLGGAGGLGGFGLMGPGMMAPGASYRVTWLPTERVTNQDGAHLGFVDQDLSLTCPLWSEGKDVVLVRANVRSQLFQTDALLPTNLEQPFPEQFWNVSLGLAGVHTFDNGWTGGGGVSGGSASNKPFESTRELNASVFAFLRVPVRETDAWNFSLFYSPLGQLPFPVPGVSYFWHPSPSFYANIGLPFALHYQPVQDVSLDLSYMLLTTVHARATYHVSGPLRVYCGYNWINEVYHLDTETTSADRFFYYEMNVVGGARWVFNRHAWLDLSTGYAFDRFYSEGQLFGSSANNNRLDVGSGPFLSGQFGLRW